MRGRFSWLRLRTLCIYAYQMINPSVLIRHMLLKNREFSGIWKVEVSPLPSCVPVLGYIWSVIC